MNIFFTCKNTLVILVQLYRFLILCLERRPVYRKQSRLFSMIPSENFDTDSKTENDAGVTNDSVKSRPSTSRKNGNPSGNGKRPSLKAR